jgi:biotin synthase
MSDSKIEFSSKNQSSEPSMVSPSEALSILDSSMSLPNVVHTASIPREKYFGKKVRIHILDNIKNGHCPEDCGYCAQRKNGNSGIQEFSLKSQEEIFQDAIKAKESGAYRFCMVTAGTGPSEKSILSLSSTIKRISEELGLKVCLSAGLLDSEKAGFLKEAGLDRYNHNLNTSESHYGEICTTHTYNDRIQTLSAMNNAGVGLCSGAIVGMGESNEDLVEIAFKLKELKVISIPINFFIQVSGHAIKNPGNLTPEFCIRILSMFRLVNPDSEIRVAAGREGHLRSLQSLSLFVANSLFASGYLNVKGSDIQQTVQMIGDSGFEVEWESSEGNFILEESHPYSSENIKNLYKYKKE